MNKLRIYVSGKITGLQHEVAKEYFDQVTKQLRSAGHEAVNPMEVCPYNPEWTWEQYMAKDIEVLLGCEAIFMLGNWRDSKGARIEHYIASETHKKIYYAQNHDLFIF